MATQRQEKRLAQREVSLLTLDQLTAISFKCEVIIKACIICLKSEKLQIVSLMEEFFNIVVIKTERASFTHKRGIKCEKVLI